MALIKQAESSSTISATFEHEKAGGPHPHEMGDSEEEVEQLMTEIDRRLEVVGDGERALGSPSPLDGRLQQQRSS